MVSIQDQLHMRRKRKEKEMQMSVLGGDNVW